MDIESIGAGNSLIERVKGIILKPNEEWPKIAAEPTSQMDVLKRYVLPLAAIGPVASFIGGQVFGYGGPFITVRTGVMSGLSTAILSFVMAIVGVFVLTFIADWLAPKFEGKSNRTAAFKLVAYAMTAMWVAGIFGLIPALAFFGILGLYSIYLFYTGAGPMMAVPEAQRIAYTAITFVVGAAFYFIASLIVGVIVAAFGFGAALTSGIAGASNNDDVTVSIPGVGSINTGEMEEAAERMEKVQRGEIKPVPVETLKGMLPDAIGDYKRTAFSSTAVGNLGSGVDGTYTSGDKSFTLRVNDMLAGGGLAAIAGMVNIQSEQEDANGYERIGKVDGQWRSEKWQNSGSGSYSIFVADRFQVEASGNVSSIDVLKSAVAAIDAGDLEGLAEE